MLILEVIHRFRLTEMSQCKKCGSYENKVDSTYPFHNIYKCSTCGNSRYIRIEECCRTPFLLVTILRYDFDRYTLYQQCFNCGGADKTKSLNKKQYVEELRGEFDEGKFQHWKQQRYEEGQMLFKSICHDNYLQTNAYKYYTYLQSDTWKQKRAKVLIRDNGQCQLCKVQSATDVHHLTYDRIYEELLEDLLSVCRGCHTEVHRNQFLSSLMKE